MTKTEYLQLLAKDVFDRLEHDVPIGHVFECLLEEVCISVTSAPREELAYLTAEEIEEVFDYVIELLEEQ